MLHLQNYPNSHNMLPAFQINNFKPWTPLPAKPYPPHRTLNAANTQLELEIFGRNLIRPCYAQDETRTTTKPPRFREDNTARNILSPSASSSTDSLEGFLRILDSLQDNFPIDLVILANLGPWETDGITILETTCLYPEPLAILSSPASRCEVPGERDGSDNSDIQGSLRSTLVPRDSFAALRSQFTSLPLDDRLQFLSWLFEGALSHCMSDTSQTACEELKARESRRSRPRPEINQSWSVRKSVRTNPRKGMPWSTEEVDLLVRLRKDEG
ncbi:hypothetical protein BJX66DRAFT_351982 [Aspergillus keveii]|uniref:Uncharacterized protein n=1 Tax=Aspergillus keveii TaxID=714993 RepID=A0ABR4G2G9_9EURO